MQSLFFKEALNTFAFAVVTCFSCLYSSNTIFVKAWTRIVTHNCAQSLSNSLRAYREGEPVSMSQWNRTSSLQQIDVTSSASGTVPPGTCALSKAFTSIFMVWKKRYVASPTSNRPPLLMALVHSVVYAMKLLSSPATAISESQLTTGAASSVFLFLYF